jgi:predicted PurR-regulated permease PerM
MLELIPILGPTLAAIPAVLIGFGISPVIGLATAALAFLIQQLENYVLVPKILQQNVGVNPIATLICLAIGARLAGVAGLLIAVPVFISIEVVLRRYFSTTQQNNLIPS